MIDKTGISCFEDLLDWSTSFDHIVKKKKNATDDRRKVHTSYSLDFLTTDFCIHCRQLLIGHLTFFTLVQKVKIGHKVQFL